MHNHRKKDLPHHSTWRKSSQFAKPPQSARRPCFNLGEVSRELQVPDGDKRSFLQSAKEADVVHFLNRTGELLANHCQSYCQMLWMSS